MRGNSKVSANLFFQVAGVAWEYLHRTTQQAVRQSSSTGRTLHDSRTTNLVVRLGHSKPDAADDEQNSDSDDEEANVSEGAATPSPPTPAVLRSALATMVQRGARPQTLRLRFFEPEGGHLPAHEREAQLLAALQALGGSPVTQLVMSGGVPLSRAVASAVANAFPSLVNLFLRFLCDDNDLPQGDRHGDAAAQYYYGAIQLLALCGPRLRELELLGGVQQWPTVAFQALRECTALTRLEVEAGYGDTDDEDTNGRYLDTPAQEDSILASIGQLTSLRSLSLLTRLAPAVCTPDVLAPHITSMARLSTLTALTRLQLELPIAYQHHGDSWSERNAKGNQHVAWCAAREDHRTSLLSALHCMPQLQHLDCPTLWLWPSQATSLTALTSLKLGGLLLPPPPSASGGGSSDGAFSLPARLVDLTLNTTVSPRLLASLQVPSTLTALHLWWLCFGMSDVTPDNRLLPETVEAVGPALQLISSLRAAEPTYSELVFDADGAPGVLLPRTGVSEGHVEWLRHLTAVEGVEVVKLRTLALQFEDMCCLAQAVGGCERLSIVDSSFPVAAITALLGLEATEELELDLSRASGLNRSSLETALTVLCLQTRKLRRVACTKCPLRNTQELQEAVMAKLRSRGQEGVALTITR